MTTCASCNFCSLGGWCIRFDFKVKPSNPACLEHMSLEDDEEMKR
jgi:hypothetical protein